MTTPNPVAGNAGDAQYDPLKESSEKGCSNTSQIERTQRRKAIKYIVAEGAPSALALNAANSYTIPLAIALNASSFQIGLMNAWPNLAAALSQIGAPSIGRRLGSRKRMTILSIGLSIVAWVGLIAAPFFVSDSRIWGLLSFATLAVTMYYLPQGAFGSWAADIIPSKRLGKVMGTRNSLASIATVVALIGGGLILDWFRGDVFIGFAIIFGAVIVSRLVSLFIFYKMYEPRLESKPGATDGILSFLKSAIHSNLGSFLFAYGILFYGASMAGPFFSVYMLKELNFSYLVFMIVLMVATLATVAASLLWGPFSDRHGNVRVLKLTIWAVSLMPLLWLPVDSAGKAFIVQLFAGAAWAGFSLASINFVYEISGGEERVRNVAYLFGIQGIAAFLGSMTGGAVVPHLPPIFGSHLLTLFALSGFVRVWSVFIVLTRVREVRRPILVQLQSDT